MSFNGIPVKRVKQTTHLGFLLDSKLNFQAHINTKLSKVKQGLGLLKQFFQFAPRKSLEDIYKMHIRPHLDYADVIFHTPDIQSNMLFSDDDNIPTSMKKLESIQYNAALITTGAWKGSSCKKLYKELGWESLYLRRESRRLHLFYEILILQRPPYLHGILDGLAPRPLARGPNAYILQSFFPNTNYFKASYFPATLDKWNELDISFKRSPSLQIFKNKVLTRVRPKRNEMFGVSDKAGLAWLTQLRLGLSPLRLHKFQHHFVDTFDPMCLAGDGIESTQHYLLHCHTYAAVRVELFRRVSVLINSNLHNFSEDDAEQILLFGHDASTTNTNNQVLKETISFIRNTNRFT